MDIYNEICEVRIQTEGYKGGYIVRIVGQDETTTYQLSRSDFEGIVKQLRDKAVEKGDTDSIWKKVS